MKEVRLYVASPFGFSEAGRDFMYAKIIPPIEELGYEVIDPWKLTPDETVVPVINMPYGQEKKNKWQLTNRIIGKNNEDGILRSTGLVAILDGNDVDPGTASEIGFATALGKKTLGYRGDSRLCCDNEGSIVNLQVEHWIYSRGGKIITEIADMKKELKTIFG